MKRKIFIQNGLVIGSIFILLSIVCLPVSSIELQVNEEIKSSSIKLNQGNTLYVGGSGPGNYTKIQDAIDDASDGDTVFVFNGHYIESVEINKSIDLIGEDNIRTIIERDQPGATIWLTKGFVNISNLNITNSNDDWGGVTLWFVEQPVWIKNNNFFNNNHGIKVDNSPKVFIENNTINCCDKSGSRGVYYGGSGIIQYNTISRCWWGITFSSDSRGSAIHNTIFNNEWYGIMSIASKPYIANNTIFHNKQGINSRCRDRAIIEYNLIYENSEDGIMFGFVGEQPNCHPIISNNIIIWNEYGINCHDSTNSIIRNNTIVYNNRNGIRCYRSNPTIIDNTIISNGKKGIYYNNGPNGDLIEHNFISEHTEHGIYIRNVEPNILNNTITSNSIGIYVDTETPIINYNNIMGNSEYGVYFRDYLGYLDARYNWWGSSDGPGGDGPGSGDKIGIEKIRYSPWLNEENQNAYPSSSVTNNPPNKPTKPDGPINAKCYDTCYYSTKTTDPDDNFLIYGWDWDGDLDIDEYTGIFKSGEEISESNRWDTEGTYEIRVKAFDIFAWDSEWSDPLIINIERKSRETHNTLFYRLLESFPFLEKILLFHFI